MFFAEKKQGAEWCVYEVTINVVHQHIQLSESWAQDTFALPCPL